MKTTSSVKSLAKYFAPLRILSLVLLLTLSGCPINLDTENYPRAAPKAEDLVGTYSPDEATKKLIAEQGHYPARETSITLAADGTFTIRNIPDWWHNDFGKPTGGFDSGSGKWSVEKKQSWWALGMEIHATTQFDSQPPRDWGFITNVALAGDKPPYMIHLIVGDADEGRVMIFKKDSGAAK